MIKDKYKKLPMFWKITIASTIVFIVFILFIFIAQSALFLDWFIKHKNKYDIDLSIFKDMFESYWDLVIVSGILGTIISILGGVVVSKVFLKDVKKLTNTMEEIKNEGSLDKRVEIEGDRIDEFAKLGLVFNSLMDDVEDSFDREKRFVQDASHELKTPLTIIRGHLSLLNRWGKNDKEVLEKSLKTSLEEVDRLIYLVNNLLDMSKLDNIKEKLKGNSNIKEVVYTVLENFKLISPKYNINVEYNNVEEFPMDALYLKQILIIFIDNAIKYSGENKDINLIFEKYSDRFSFEVVDKGIGISKENIDKLFNRFYRVDESRNSKTGGNGLGLSISKKIVDSYGGEIFVTSKEGEGSSFKVIIEI